MTSAQRKYDQDLTASMRQMAAYLLPRSRKVSDTLKVAADRIDALSSATPVEQPPGIDASGQVKQPASTPDEAKRL